MLEDLAINLNSIIGYPLNNMELAPFDPLFWIHYANIDRIYESYLKSQNIEFIKHEMMQYKQTTLSPFTHKNGQQCFAKDVLSIEQLGYIYDATVVSDDTKITNNDFKARSYVIFPGINITEYDSSCYELHVFVMPKNDTLNWDQSLQLNTHQQFVNNPYYAGSTKIFGLKCKSCFDDGKTFDLRVDVTSSVKQQNLELK